MKCMFSVLIYIYCIGYMFIFNSCIISVLFSPVHHVSAPGEIRQEYEAMVAMEQQELLQRKSKEDMASAQLIQKFQVKKHYFAAQADFSF